MLLVLSSGSNVMAQGSTQGSVQAPAQQAPRRLYAATQGQAAFERGDYRASLDHFQRAYELTGAPILLYNIGQAADRLRLDATALRAFQLYLRRYPEAPNHDEVVHRIQALELKVETNRGALTAGSEPRDDRTQLRVNVSETLLPSPYNDARAPARGPDQATQAQPLLENAWFWVATGAVVVALVTTIVLVSGGGETASANAAVSAP